MENNDTITVTLLGKGKNYEGSILVSYRYIKASQQLGKVKALKLAAKSFTGREVLLGRANMLAAGYQKLFLSAAAKGEFRPPFRNTLRIRPGDWCDFVGLLCPEPEREHCRREIVSAADVPVRAIEEIKG